MIDSMAPATDTWHLVLQERKDPTPARPHPRVIGWYRTVEEAHAILASEEFKKACREDGVDAWTQPIELERRP
ncbi:MAG: hypothetical protein AAGA90_07745 [Actinomycetota bacterium]